MRSVRISAWVLAMLLTCSPLSALAVETDLLPARRAAPDFSDTAGTAYEEAASVVYEAGVMNGFTPCWRKHVGTFFSIPPDSRSLREKVCENR